MSFQNLMNPYGEEDEGINPFGSGTIASTAAGPMMGKAKKKKGTGMGWQDILSSGLHGAQNGGLAGAGFNIAKDALIQKYVKGGAAKAILSFL